MEQKRRDPGVQMEVSALPKSNITSSPCKVKSSQNEEKCRWVGKDDVGKMKKYQLIISINSVKYEGSYQMKIRDCCNGEGLRRVT